MFDDAKYNQDSAGDGLAGAVVYSLIMLVVCAFMVGGLWAWVNLQ